MTPELSVLIVNYNTWRDCAAAVRSLRKQPPTRPDGSVMPYEVIVVDNNSPFRDPGQIQLLRDALAEVAADFADDACGRLILHDENGGYSKGVNLCFRQSRGRYILVSNPDLVFPEGCISALQRHLEANPRVGCVVPKGYWAADFEGRLPPNTLPSIKDLLAMAFGEYSRTLRRAYGRWLAKDWVRVWLAEEPIDLEMMSGCLFLMERDYFESIGLLDERYPLYYEDADLSRKLARSGRTLTQVPDSRLIHFVNRSGQTDFETMMTRHDISRGLYFRKWYGWFGSATLAACRWLERTPLLKPLRKEAPDGGYQDLGASTEPPRIQLPRHCDRFLLLMSLDCRFYLSGGLFGSGDHWQPSAEMFANFSPTTYWYRAFDLSNGRFGTVGTWKFVCQPRPQPTAAPASQQAEQSGQGCNTGQAVQ